MALPLARCQQHVARLLSRTLPEPQESCPLYSAMHYACFNGGKRLRPLLVYSTGELFDLPWETLDPFALAAELIHCYSLVHDDLPSMDNDDFRRGKPSCHKVYGEATALLAGNALLTLAFEILGQELSVSTSETQLKIIRLFAKASGAEGMMLGQCLDLLSSTSPPDLEYLHQIHLNKTGALIAACVECVPLLAQTPPLQAISALATYAKALGFAFQIRDDILDAVTQDSKVPRTNFVTILGADLAQHYLDRYYRESLDVLAYFKDKANALKALAQLIVERVA